MAAIVLPVAKAIYFCDDMVSDPARNKLMIVGMFNAIRVPEGSAFPYTLGKLCIFAQLAGGIGEVPARLDIVRAATGDIIYSTGSRLLRFPGRQTTITFSLRLQQFPFPAPGEYLVEFFCYDRYIDDRLLRVIE